MTGPVILVDDDPDLRRATAQALKLAGFEEQAFDAPRPRSPRSTTASRVLSSPTSGSRG